MSEIDLSVQYFCDVLVFSELGSVVGGDGKDMMLKRAEQLDDDLGHSLCILTHRGLYHEHFLCGAFNDGDDGPFAVLADVSSSQSPKRALESTTAGRSSMLTLSLMGIRELTGFLRCLR